MILLWLGLVALLQSCVSLLPADWFPGAAWLQLFLFAGLAAVVVQGAAKLRRVPVFGVQGQWLILPAVLVLFLVQGGLPGEPGSIAALLGLPLMLQKTLTLAAQITLVVGLWQALSNLARSPERSMITMDPGLHGALTELVLPPLSHKRPAPNARSTRRGLTPPLRAALEKIGDAHRVLRDKVLQMPNDIATRLALHRRLADDPSQYGIAVQHGSDFIDALMEVNRTELALSVAGDCARVQPDYFPPNDQALALAQHAIVLGQFALALRLLRHFDVRNPSHEAVPQALMYCAQALGGMGRAAPAQALLSAIMERYPDHVLAAEAVAVSAKLATRAH